jgi:hypothetical protein
MKYRLSYLDIPRACNDIEALCWLKAFKEDLSEFFHGWTHFGQPIPDAIALYFNIRPTLERFGRAKELDEAFKKNLPADYKDMPYDPRFGFYTNVSDSEDIIQIDAPVLWPSEVTIRLSESLPKFCQPMCGDGDLGFPDCLIIPPYKTWWSKEVIKENRQMEYVKVEAIE